MCFIYLDMTTPHWCRERVMVYYFIYSTIQTGHVLFIKLGRNVFYACKYFPIESFSFNYFTLTYVCSAYTENMCSIKYFTFSCDSMMLHTLKFTSNYRVIPSVSYLPCQLCSYTFFVTLSLFPGLVSVWVHHY